MEFERVLYARADRSAAALARVVAVLAPVSAPGHARRGRCAGGVTSARVTSARSRERAASRRRSARGSAVRRSARLARKAAAGRAHRRGGSEGPVNTASRTAFIPLGAAVNGGGDRSAAIGRRLRSRLRLRLRLPAAVAAAVGVAVAATGCRICDGLCALLPAPDCCGCDCGCGCGRGCGYAPRRTSTSRHRCGIVVRALRSRRAGTRTRRGRTGAWCRRRESDRSSSARTRTRGGRTSAACSLSV